MKRTATQIAVIACVLVLAISTAAVEKRDGKPPYKSSIQVPDNDDEEENQENEADEQAQLQSLAKITKQQAIDAALKQVPGKLVEAELDNEDGNLVYSVEVKMSDGVTEVIVDAGNGKVLLVSKEDDQDEEDEN